VPGPSNPIIRTFQPADEEALTRLLRASLASGEQAGHTSSDVASIVDSYAVVPHLLVAELDDEPVGLISPANRFIVVRSDVRRRGIGRALVDAAVVASEGSPEGPVILFPPHNSPDALKFLHAVGFRYDHSLWRFRLDPQRQEKLPPLTSDLSLANYRDDDLLPYIELINTTFLDHPVPLHVTREQIEHIHARSNFDPEAIALLQTSDGTMVGFCVTGEDQHEDPPVGIINLLGVKREFRGRGLGRWLLIWGIDRLRSVGLNTIELGAEADNEQAVQLYRSVGFEAIEEWPQWMRA